jgi:hypothetical protein
MGMVNYNGGVGGGKQVTKYFLFFHKIIPTDLSFTS